MSQPIYLSDESYKAIEELAAKQGETPQAFIEALIDEYLCNPDAEMATGQYTRYDSSEAFMKALGASDELIAKAHERDKGW